MVQIGFRGTARRLFENFKKFSKITEFEFQNSCPSFFASVSYVYCKKIHLIRTKLMEEIDFEVFRYGDSGNGTPAAARRIEPVAQRHTAIEARGHSEQGAFETGVVRNWGRNRAVKTNRLVVLIVIPRVRACLSLGALSVFLSRCPC